MAGESCLCLDCLAQLPETGFAFYPGNPVEKSLTGRLHLEKGMAAYYFGHGSLMQRLMHQLKYKGYKELGRQLGRLMGQQLIASERFSDIEALVPLPLSKARERQRGFNQAAVICEGIAALTGWPIIGQAIQRVRFTGSQTDKSRVDRWLNAAGRFSLSRPELLQGKHLLLVDDVITTGATLEACGSVLAQALDARLSIATLCVAMART